MELSEDELRDLERAVGCPARCSTDDRAPEHRRIYLGDGDYLSLSPEAARRIVAQFRARRELAEGWE